jgi:hypothetical protein
LLVTLLFGVSVAQAIDVPFAEHLISTNLNNPQSAYPADIDNDGDIDAVVASRVGGKIVWFQNSGGLSPTFTEFFIGTSFDARGVFPADVDGDGDTDVLSTSAFYGSRELVWWENNGATIPSFTKRLIQGGRDFFPVYAIDIDDDGDTDILAATGPTGPANNRISLFLNNGALLPSFVEQVISTSVNWPFSLFATDVDGDSDTDVLSASRWDDKIAWYENNGGLYTQRVISTNADEAVTVFASDLDGDGDTDVISSSDSDDKVSWYENDGGLPPVFTERIITSTANGARYAFPADVDNDGDVDVLVAIGRSDQFAWYDNEGGLPPSFSEHIISTLPSGSAPITIQAADIDGDGDTDFLALTSESYRLLWYENLGRVGFDIKPGSCPNPLNVKSKGVLPAAIMGTENLDVTQVDPDTLRLRLKGTEEPLVPPLRWALADVGEPFAPFIGKEDCFQDCLDCSCPDGYLDLVFHFDTQEVVAALGEVNDEDCLVMEIIGNLKEESGGTPIVGEDVVRILRKGKQ